MEIQKDRAVVLTKPFFSDLGRESANNNEERERGGEKEREREKKIRRK